jgi:hypothetical protein
VFVLPHGAEDKVFAYFIKDGQSKVLVLLNFSQADRLRVNIQHEALAGGYKNVMSGLEHQLNPQETFEMQAWEFMVYASV